MGKHRTGLRVVVGLVVAGAVGLAASCSSVRKPKGLKRSESLSAEIAEYASNLESMKGDLRRALEAYDRILESPSGDLLAPYAELREGIEGLARRNDAIPALVEDLEDAATSFFAAWEEDLRAFTDASLRERSARRLDETRQRYGTLLANHEKVSSAVGALVTTMRDHALFWANDLNAESARSLERDVTELQEASEDIVAGIEGVIEAASDYRRAVAVSPGAAPVAAPRN